METAPVVDFESASGFRLASWNCFGERDRNVWSKRGYIDLLAVYETENRETLLDQRFSSDGSVTLSSCKEILLACYC